MAGQRIRILHVITRLVVGGAQENTLLTVGHLNRTHYEVTLAYGPSIGPEGSLEDRIPKDISVEPVPELVRHPDPVEDVLALRRLYTLMRQRRYHIVHTHTTKAGIVGRLAARFAQVPIVIHTPHGHAFHAYLNRTGSAALRWTERSLARWTDRIVCLTATERQDHVRLGIGPLEQFEVIHSGVDLERFKQARIDPKEKRRELGLPLHGPLVGCVARLVPVKGVEDLLAAVPEVLAVIPQATVVFVGDGPLRPMLERRAAAMGLNGSVAFVGLRGDIPELMRLFDVVALPSLNEGMGKAAVEAMAAGCPVVGSRISGIQDVIVDGQTGLLVPPRAPGALARAITRCLTDAAFARAIGQRASIAAESYGIEPMIVKLDRLYRQALDTKGRGHYPPEFLLRMNSSE